MKIKNASLICQKYLDKVYSDVSIRYPVSSDSSYDISKTYGEILYPSIEKLLSLVSVTKNDIFVDLGSGLGKIVLQAFINTPVKEAHGIELLVELHEKSLLVNQRVQQELPELYSNERRVVLSQGSFLETPFNIATVALINSMCYSQNFLNHLGRIIDHTPSIHTFMTLRPILTMQRLRFKKAVRIECTWDTTLCYIYSS